MANPSPVVKHHFWILAGATPLFIGLAFLLMLLLVGGALADAQKEFKTTKEGLNTPAKSDGDMQELGNKVTSLEDDRLTLWKRSYAEQKKEGVFNWPDSKHGPFNALGKRDMKFGEAFTIGDRVTAPPVLTETFTRGYTRVAEDLAPTRFATGSYVTALRTVTDWGTIAAEPGIFWLALEDFWVQRGLLDPIAKMNAAAALFADVTPKEAKDADVKRNFRNRTWELDLEVAQQGNKQVLQGQLRNRTPRLQALGVNKAMKVHVWMRDLPADVKTADLPPPDVVYEIRGESVPGKGSLTCPPQEIFVTTATKITRVAQVFDEATVPVRLVSTVELGILDHRNKAATLELPKHIEADEAASPDTTAAIPGDPYGGGTGGSPGSGLSGVGTGVGGRPMGEGEGPGGGMYGNNTTAAKGKSGNVAAVLTANKKRYIKRTDDVRRMPVGVSVVIDNDYTNDLMVAFTNSPLHFQVTQTQWARFKGTLPGVAGATSGSGTIPVEPGAGEGDGGTGLGGPAGGRLGGTQTGPSGLPGIPGLPGGIPGLPGGSTMTSTTVGALPAEANANLCEFALFGIVSLYEKEVPKEPKPEDGTAQPDPMGKPDPAKPDADKKEPEKKEPEKTEPEKKDGEKKEPDAKEPPKPPTVPPPPGEGKKEPEKKEPEKKDGAPTPPNK